MGRVTIDQNVEIQGSNRKRMIYPGCHKHGMSARASCSTGAATPHGDKAMKCRYAGVEWDDETMQRTMQAARRESGSLAM